MGQTGIVNTLSHIHIPVLLSIARVGIGLVIGCIIGLALWSILSRAALRVDR
jgi:xanthosine utilization system XapX-like protein